MDSAKANIAGGVSMDDIGEDKVFTVIRNTTKNQKVVLSSLGGIEVPPGGTVNLRERFRKVQLFDAAQDIQHFISLGVLEDMSNKEPVLTPEQQKNVDITGELQKKVDEAKKRDLLTEIMGSTLLSRLQDIMITPNMYPEVIREAKIRYMQVKGWIDDNGNLIEGATDDNNEPIESVEKWTYKPGS